MQAWREPIDLSWTGPLAEAEVPTAILYAVVLVFEAAVTRKGWRTVAEALAPAWGAVRSSRWTLRGRELEFSGELGVQVLVGAGRVQAIVRQRTKGQRLARLVRDLAAVPGAADLRLRAQGVRHGRGAEPVMLDG